MRAISRCSSFCKLRNQLTRLRELRAESDEQRLRIEGWLRTFGAHTIDSPRGAALAEELAADEGRLQVARGEMKLGFEDPKRGFVPASSIALSHLLQNDPDEARRQAAFDGLRSIESYVLRHGYLQIVAKRNELGRTLGAEDYYDWKTKRIEGMSKHELFGLLDELEERTRPAARAFVDDSAAQAWRASLATVEPRAAHLRRGHARFRSVLFVSLRDRSLGPLVRRTRHSLRGRGARARLARPTRESTKTASCTARSWLGVAQGQRIPARIQFTANALPGAVGAGQQALRTLFHEGGHAAHFSNIDMPSPCFGQEFAPTSTAFAETQSMFLDSLPERRGLAAALCARSRRQPPCRSP